MQNASVWQGSEGSQGTRSGIPVSWELHWLPFSLQKEPKGILAWPTHNAGSDNGKHTSMPAAKTEAAGKIILNIMHTTKTIVPSYKYGTRFFITITILRRGQFTRGNRGPEIPRDGRWAKKGHWRPRWGSNGSHSLSWVNATQMPAPSTVTLSLDIHWDTRLQDADGLLHWGKVDHINGGHDAVCPQSASVCQKHLWMMPVFWLCFLL